MRAAKEYINNGHSILIFPEGHRTKTGEINDFKRLPFLLAQEANVDIVPVAMSGLHKIMPVDSLLIRPGKVKLSFGDLIPVEEIHRQGTRAICKLTRDKVVSMRIAP